MISKRFFRPLLAHCYLAKQATNVCPSAHLPVQFFSAIQSYCPCISVGLLSYNSRSTLMRLNGRKKIGRVPVAAWTSSEKSRPAIEQKKLWECKIRSFFCKLKKTVDFLFLRLESLGSCSHKKNTHRRRRRDFSDRKKIHCTI